jgi:hypothetical protein
VYVPIAEDLLVHEKFGREWSPTKVIQEAAWSETESLVLRHLQVVMFERVKDSNDWWIILRKAYEEHIERTYRLMLEDLRRPNGWFHPTLMTSTNERFIDMELEVLSSVER